MKRKTVFITVFSLLAALLLTAAAAGGVIYFRAAMYGAVELDAQVLEPENPTLGQDFALELTCTLPWSQQITDVDFVLPEGLLQTAPPQIQKVSRQINGRTVRIICPVKAYRTGVLKPVKAELQIERPWFKNAPKKTALQLALPRISIEPKVIAKDAELPVAGAIEPPPEPHRKNYRSWLLPAAVVLPAAIILAAGFYFLIRRKHKQYPPWVTAQLQLEKLRQQLQNHPQDLRNIAIKSGEILLDYLSKRYQWDLAASTSGELSLLLQQNSGYFQVRQIEFLEIFMQKLDLIKFANIKPDSQFIAAAISQIIQLVQDTTPQTDTKNSTER
ncbi:MAG: hypothetical protein E7047_03640 [Lentisphaerae bacterium]|nr:hypothetical protein [Lentisphaerota bacterium]